VDDEEFTPLDEPPKQEHRRMIVVKLQGGLGNQMFQYAVGRELQRRNGGEFALDLTQLLDRFPRTNTVVRDYNLDIFGSPDVFVDG
jgi:hypothetical protein